MKVESDSEVSSLRIVVHIRAERAGLNVFLQFTSDSTCPALSSTNA